MSVRRVALLVVATSAAAAVAVVAVVVRPDAPTGAPDGRTLFVDKGCAACHGSQGDGPVVPGIGPPLDDAGDWAGHRVEGLSAEEYLTESIVAPWAFVSPAWSGASGPSGPTTRMPALSLTDDEVAAIVGYLLGPTPDGQG